MKKVEKSWGYELWIHNDEDYCGKLLFIEKNKRCSLHFHIEKKETFYVQSGRIEMRIIKNAQENIEIIEVGSKFEVPKGLVHQMTALEDTELFEFSTQHFDEDSYRIER